MLLKNVVLKLNLVWSKSSFFNWLKISEVSMLCGLIEKPLNDKRAPNKMKTNFFLSMRKLTKLRSFNNRCIKVYFHVIHNLFKTIPINNLILKNKAQTKT